MDISSTRRVNLLSLIRAAGSITALAERANVSAPYLSQIKTGFREMGSSTARRIEQSLGLQQGVLDQPHDWDGFKPRQLAMFEPGEVVDLETRRQSRRWRRIDEDGRGGTIEWIRVDLLADIGDTPLVTSSPVRSIEFSEAFLRSLTNAPDLSTLACIPMPGDGMMPTINGADLLIVDTAVTRVSTDGIYFFGFKSGTHVKRLQVVGSGLSVRSDNTNYEPWMIESDDVPQMTVHGRVIASIPFSGIKRLG